jgi:hypothetical protein
MRAAANAWYQPSSDYLRYRVLLAAAIMQRRQ